MQTNRMLSSCSQLAQMCRALPTKFAINQSHPNIVHCNCTFVRQYYKTV